MQKFELEVDPTKVRSDNGIMKTEGLFLEAASKIEAMANRLPPEPVYTLKDYDHKGYPSMYLIYMDSATEYEAAMRLLGSWRHWNKLVKAPFFKPYIEEWREERKHREDAIARTALLESIVDGNVSAAKTILDEGKRKGAGRPTKAEVEGELKKAAGDEANIAHILNRMKDV